jgi:hypothetical protein
MKTYTLKTLAFVFFSMLISGYSYSHIQQRTQPPIILKQTAKGSFKIVNNRHKDLEAFYITSIEQADFESYRLKSTEVTLYFENGFECVLISAKELYLIDKNINPASYDEEHSLETYSTPTFLITDSGLIKAKTNESHKRAVDKH